MTTTPERGWRTSEDGRVLAVSEVWLEIIGRQASEAPRYCWLNHVYEEDRERVEAEIAAHWAARRAYVVAFRALHHSGRIVLVRAGGMPHPDGGYVGWLYAACPEQRRPNRTGRRSSASALPLVNAFTVG